MQKDPTWREVGAGGGGCGGLKELLASSPRLWKHICLPFSATHLFCILRSPSHSCNRNFELLTVQTLFTYFGGSQKLYFFRVFLVTFHATCHILSNFLGIELFGRERRFVLFLANVLWPSDTLLLPLPQAVRLTCKYVSALQWSPF